MGRTFSTDFWNGFQKQATPIAAATELAGLGTLAAPSIQRLRGKPMKEKNEHKAELAGLGILAAHPAIEAGRALRHDIGRIAKRIR